MTELIVHIVGARPNFMKAAPVVDALRDLGANQRVVHTGQHYDERMSDVFFRDLGMPEPDVNLGVGSGSHAAQTAALMVGLEQTFLELRPSVVVVYGDVNSTLAATLVAAKLHIASAHVEAGLRSFDMTMPEEVNRRVTDLLCDLHFVTSPEGIAYLANEGVPAARIHLVGNSMIDTLQRHLPRFEPDRVKAQLGLQGRYAVSTLHRPSNVDDAASAQRVVSALCAVAAMVPVVLPLHPRGRSTLAEAGLMADPGIHVIDPLGYVEFMSLVAGSSLVITDSGGIQEETTMLGVPCLTLRPNTERPITISHGTNQLVEPEDVAEVAKGLLEDPPIAPLEGPPLWDGRTGPRIARILVQWLAARGDG